MLRVAVSSSSDMKEEDGTEASRPITGGGSCPLVIVGSEASNRSALLACQMEGLRLRSCCVHQSPTSSTRSIWRASKSPPSHDCWLQAMHYFMEYILIKGACFFCKWSGDAVGHKSCLPSCVRQLNNKRQQTDPKTCHD